MNWTRSTNRVAQRYISANKVNLSHYHLDLLVEGLPTMLYHGTTRMFRQFDITKSRDDLVNKFYGAGIFLTPSKKVAWDYADANRNIGFDPSIIQDLRKSKPLAAKFLQDCVTLGEEAWEKYASFAGELEEYLGANPNTLESIASYVLGSKVPVHPTGSGLNLFDTSTGAPEWLYDSLDEVGIDSKKYRPKVYTVLVTAKNVLVTARKAEARSARRKGYDAVVFTGADLVRGVPEVAVFNPRNAQILKVEVS